MITVRKLQLTIINDDEQLRKEQYKFIRDSIYSQYQGLNRCMGYLMSGYYSNNMDIKSQDFKDFQKTIKNSCSCFDGLEFGKGIDSKSAITQKVKKDFSIALKNGLAKGERSVNNYKRDFPLMTRGRDLKFYQEENSDEIYIKWVNKISFKVILSYKINKNYIELQHFLRKVITGEYKIGQSTLEFNKKNKLILNLTCDIPEKQKEDLDENKIVGIDVGMKIPAYVMLYDKNNPSKNYIGEGIGSYDDLTKVKCQFKNRYERLQRQLKLTKGGHGRKDKLKRLNSLSEKEKNYTRTYNHLISKRVIEFAKKNNAKQINMELLHMSDEDKMMSTIRNWSYYQLQTQIKYKAEREGIIVKTVDPYMTSQTCSICGNCESGQRNTQETFKCKKCGHTENADRNASRNIAKSTDYIDKKEQSKYFKYINK